MGVRARLDPACACYALSVNSLSAMPRRCTASDGGRARADADSLRFQRLRCAVRGLVETVCMRDIANLDNLYSSDRLAGAGVHSEGWGMGWQYGRIDFE